MNALALLLYAIFGAVALVWRIWLQWRRTGDTGLRMRSTAGALQWWAKLTFVLAILTGIAAPIAGLAGLEPVSPLDETIVQIAGAIMAVLGIAATVAAQLQMGASWRMGVDTSERTDLVTTGVFGAVRNPIYTAMMITSAGIALIVGNVVAVIGLLALALALEIQVRFLEEPYLRTIHGRTYEHYAARAGRFLPRIGRARRT
jgi:protein-S-isoprenylcysteine O-methyltransferase Ste14